MLESKAVWRTHITSFLFSDDKTVSLLYQFRNEVGLFAWHSRPCMTNPIYPSRLHFTIFLPTLVPQSASVHRYCTGPTEVFPVFSTLPWLGFNRFKQLRTFFPATYYILSLHGKYQLLVTINTDLLNLTECIYIQQIHTNLFMPIENCSVGFTMNVFPSRDRPSSLQQTLCISECRPGKLPWSWY